MFSLSLHKRASRESFGLISIGGRASWSLRPLSRVRNWGAFLLAVSALIVLAGNFNGRAVAVPRFSKQEFMVLPPSNLEVPTGSTGERAFLDLPSRPHWKYPILWAAPFWSQSGYGAEAVSYITALLRNNLVSKDDLYIMQSGDAVHSGVVSQMDPEIRNLLEGQEYKAMMKKLPPDLANRSVIVVCHTFPTCWHQPEEKTGNTGSTVSTASKDAKPGQHRALLSQPADEQAAYQDPSTQGAMTSVKSVQRVLSTQSSRNPAAEDPPSCPCPSATIKNKIVHTVGRSMFETESLPGKLASFAMAMDEVLVPSRFNVDSFAASGVNVSKLSTLAQGIDTALYHPGAQPLNLTATGFLVIGIDPGTGQPPQVPEEQPQQRSHAEEALRNEPHGGPLSRNPTAASILEVGGFGEKSIFGALVAVGHRQQALMAHSKPIGPSQAVSGTSSVSGISSGSSSRSSSSSNNHHGVRHVEPSVTGSVARSNSRSDSSRGSSSSGSTGAGSDDHDGLIVQAQGTSVDFSNGYEEQAAEALEDLQVLASMHGRRSLQAARPAAAAATSMYPLSEGGGLPSASAALAPVKPTRQGQSKTLAGPAKPRQGEIGASARSAEPRQGQSKTLVGPAKLQQDQSKPLARTAELQQGRLESHARTAELQQGQLESLAGATKPQQDGSKPFAGPTKLQQYQSKPLTRTAKLQQDPNKPLAGEKKPQQRWSKSQAGSTKLQQDQSKPLAAPTKPQLGLSESSATPAGPKQGGSKPRVKPAEPRRDGSKPQNRPAEPQQGRMKAVAGVPEVQRDPTKPTTRPAGPLQDQIGHVAKPPEPQQDQIRHAAKPPEPKPLNPFRFLSIFKWEDRKGWDILFRAYLKEFEPTEAVELHLVTHAFGAQVDNFPSFVRSAAMGVLSLKALPDAQMPRVYLHTQHIPDAKFPSIYSSANCLVVPTHGEGWGRPQMEAMACGLPVITTKWFEGQRWAQPSLAHLRRLMREVVSDPQAAAAKGEAARRHIQAHYSDLAVAREAQAHFLRWQAVVELMLTDGKDD
ncbi:hypothetical protein DUNSADRAFT_4293 [Dunaliella salina]|uniref:Glycosyl transferase family 1 domain-containing protein n=1 Tax=Dunaliella salina TaxID=3046 RepID=A0ABQ7GS96_DUNSA|nr:hypothetical protein DUNSADRAFT_4293 [Dunaliella salina]|eukprot:KAF5837489.1 hypothetical protein DUNSADRAFT_4293 [Dunaliella salina]